MKLMAIASGFMAAPLLDHIVGVETGHPVFNGCFFEFLDIGQCFDYELVHHPSFNKIVFHDFIKRDYVAPVRKTKILIPTTSCRALWNLTNCLT